MGLADSVLYISIELRCPAHFRMGAAVWQVLHYLMYLCVGIWDWARAKTPVDPGFSPRSELQRVKDAAREFYYKLTIFNALKYSFCALVIIPACVFICVIVLAQFCYLAALMCICLCVFVPCIPVMLVAPTEEFKAMLH